MAKQIDGYLGGFRGKLGPAVGYVWNGVWCLRSRPGKVRNPRTEAQQQHRELFKQEVQLAATMGQALNKGLGSVARSMHMTPQNLFVKASQEAFSLEDNQLAVDYSQLVLSAGPVAPVAFGTPEVTAGNVLSISFEKNPLHVRADWCDSVYLFVYCPEVGGGYLTAPVYRKDQRINVVLPGIFAGKVVQLYGFVQDAHGRSSETIYIGYGPLIEGNGSEIEGSEWGVNGSEGGVNGTIDNADNKEGDVDIQGYRPSHSSFTPPSLPSHSPS